MKSFDTFEQQFMELVAEFQSISVSLIAGLDLLADIIRIKTLKKTCRLPTCLFQESKRSLDIGTLKNSLNQVIKSFYGGFIQSHLSRV